MVNQPGPALWPKAMSIKGVLFDIAGVLYQGDSVVPGAIEGLKRVRAAGLCMRLVTNTSRQSKRALLAKLRGFGFDVSQDEVFTATEALVAHLVREGLRPFLLVHPDLDEEFAALDRDRPSAVVIGDAAERFTYQRLNKAFRLLIDGAPLLAIATNRYFREADGLSLDAGPFVAALEYAAQVEAKLFGKPAPAFFHAVLTDFGTSPAEVLMIGDDVEADVNGALSRGLRATLVRTGKYRPGDEQRIAEGGRCVADVGEAIDAVLNT
jgi:HAD superfamily hydrolase (TIGR01458 family)